MKNGQKKVEIQAHRLMSMPVETVQMKDPLHVVAHLFAKKHIGAAAVLDSDKKPVGVITKTDLVRYEETKNGPTAVREKNTMDLNGGLAGGYHLIEDDDTVDQWMTPVIFKVKPETTMQEMARRMVRYKIHHIFVQGRNGETIAGIVSSFDILKQVASAGGR